MIFLLCCNKISEPNCSKRYEAEVKTAEITFKADKLIYHEEVWKEIVETDMLDAWSLNYLHQRSSVPTKKQNGARITLLCSLVAPDPASRFGDTITTSSVCTEATVDVSANKKQSWPTTKRYVFYD